MKKSDVLKIIKNIKITAAKHSPEILTGIGIAGMVTTVVLAVRDTPKALCLIEEEKRRRNRELLDEAKDDDNDICAQINGLKPVEVVKIAWKPYIPAVVLGSMSIACLIGASSVNARRITAISTAYKLSETALTEYKEKVVETIGEKKEQVIKDKVNQERIEKNPVSTSEIIVTERGNTLCYDVISGRYFKSDIETIRKIENELNKRMLTEMYISLSEFYDEIGLSHTKNSDELGWNIDKDGLIGLEFGSHISEDGTPCIVIDYQVAPRYDFSRLQ